MHAAVAAAAAAIDSATIVTVTISADVASTFAATPLSLTAACTAAPLAATFNLSAIVANSVRRGYFRVESLFAISYLECHCAVSGTPSSTSQDATLCWVGTSVCDPG